VTKRCLLPFLTFIEETDIKNYKLFKYASFCKCISKVSKYRYWLVGFMVFNATFNNISVISWQSVLLVEETGDPRENHKPVASH
jgi:hypothetical protein